MIDGIDGSGKGLQTDTLVARLKEEKYPVETISFPRYGQKSAGPVEEYLNGLYGTSEEVGPYRASILFAVDRFAAAAEIEDWLKKGKIVVANRYVSSNMGHQGGKITSPAARKKFFAWNYNLEYTIFKIPKPDVSLILHVEAGVAQQLVDKKSARAYLKGAKRDIHEADLSHLKAAEKTFLQIARSFPGFTLVECMKNNSILPPEEIHEKIWKLLAKRLKK